MVNAPDASGAFFTAISAGSAARAVFRVYIGLAAGILYQKGLFPGRQGEASLPFPGAGLGAAPWRSFFQPVP